MNVHSDAVAANTPMIERPLAPIPAPHNEAILRDLYSSPGSTIIHAELTNEAGGSVKVATLTELVCVKAATTIHQFLQVDVIQFEFINYNPYNKVAYAGACLTQNQDFKLDDKGGKSMALVSSCLAHVVFTPSALGSGSGAKFLSMEEGLTSVIKPKGLAGVVPKLGLTIFAADADTCVLKMTMYCKNRGPTYFHGTF